MRKYWTGWLLLMGLIVLGVACAQPERVKFLGGTTDGISSPVFTAYNMWYEKPDSIYSTGYHVGRLLPAGTQVTGVMIKRGVSPKIYFTAASGGQQYAINFIARHHPGLTIDQFCARYFTSKSLGELTEGFTPDEMQAVKQGTLRGRMSKRAVIVAYGYPPETHTPTLESNQWTFMNNRFNQEIVDFDDQGYLK